MLNAQFVSGRMCALRTLKRVKSPCAVFASLSCEAETRVRGIRRVDRALPTVKADGRDSVAALTRHHGENPEGGIAGMSIGTAPGQEGPSQAALRVRTAALRHVRAQHERRESNSWDANACQAKSLQRACSL